MPENVRDRDELLLNAIVTGDTSGIDPRDREETFIKAIAEKIAHLPVLTKVGEVTINPTQATIGPNASQSVDGTFIITPESGYSFPEDRIPINDILVFRGCSNIHTGTLIMTSFHFVEDSLYHTYTFNYVMTNTTGSAATVSTTTNNFIFDIYRLI